jgi:hypothetical protein
VNVEDALQLVLTKLDESGLRYMITGSFASNIHGVPRATQDADIVIEPDRRASNRFLESLGEDFYVNAEAAREALTRRGIFNLIHLKTGLKVDLIVKKNRPFSQTEFLRRKQADFLGQKRWFATAEDIILAKLEWYRLGNEISDRQWRDILGVLKVQAGRLDLDYLHQWAAELNVADLFQRALKETA